MGTVKVLLDSGADISIMNETLASSIGLETSELADSSDNQVAITTNNIKKLTGRGTATIVVGKQIRVSTTIFMSRDVV